MERNPAMTFQGRAVLVVRNPYKDILSYCNVFTTKSHINAINEYSFDSIKFKDFVFTGASRCFELINDWINIGNDVYFIFYEELVEDPVKEIRKLMDYLGFPADEGRLSCLSHHLQGSFKRTVHQLADPFTPNHHRKIRNVIKEAQQMIKEKTGKDILMTSMNIIKIRFNLLNKQTKSFGEHRVQTKPKSSGRNQELTKQEFFFRFLCKPFQ
jgi:hypothetical protein